jgi:hypothetical protein
MTHREEAGRIGPCVDPIRQIVSSSMKTFLLASIISIGLYHSAAAGDLIRLESRPNFPPLYAVFISLDAEGQVASENGIPVAAQIPSLRQAAERGDTKSQVLLSKALDRRSTGSTNRVEAYKWAVVASSRGDTEAKSLVRTLDLFLSDAERVQGRSQADAFLLTARKSWRLGM